ncbi:MAG: hypothetical protein KF812_08360 [Fimbriimonadaceae bacterium]|nr:hypothetical protein [Fimbriimonadaceae bacterium]
MRGSRGWVAFALLFASLSVPAEGGATPGNPDIVMSVRHHPMGADIVTVKLLNAGYPAELLRQQASNVVCAGKPAWGIEVFESGSAEAAGFTTGQFIVERVSSPSGAVELASLVRPFLGAPSPYTLDTFVINIEEFKPIAGKTLMTHRTDTVYVEGVERASPAALEYTIAVSSQDPFEVSIPSVFVPIAEANEGKSGTSPDFLRYAFYALTLGAGASLVYFLLRRRSIV